MLKAVSSLYGKLSAQTKLVALALALIAVTGFFAYRRGVSDAEVRVKVGQLETARKLNAEAIAALSVEVGLARLAANEAARESRAAQLKADNFRVSSVPARPLPNPANPANEALLDSLYRAIITRDAKIALEQEVNAKLRFEIVQLKAERPKTDALIESLNKQIALDVQEINVLKSVKRPRLGFKAGVVAGIALAGGAVLIAR